MKKVLILSRPHPRKRYFFGKHIVTHIAQEFDLSKDEIKLLEGKGAKHWVKEGKVVAARKPKNVEEDK